VTTVVSVRLTTEQRATLDAAAKSAGKSRSDLIRERVAELPAPRAVAGASAPTGEKAAPRCPCRRRRRKVTWP